MTTPPDYEEQPDDQLHGRGGQPTEGRTEGDGKPHVHEVTGGYADPRGQAAAKSRRQHQRCQHRLVGKFSEEDRAEYDE